MATSIQKELRIYATSAAVVNQHGVFVHSAYIACSPSPQSFMRDVTAKFMADYPIEQGNRYHSFAPPIEISQAAIDDVLASKANQSTP